MRPSALIILIGLAVVISGCAAKNSSNVNATDQPGGTSATEQNTPSVEDTTRYVSYTNRFIGYKVDRPSAWYWRHYSRNEASGVDGSVDDIFVTDPQPTGTLGSDHLGRMMIEVSNRDESNTAKLVQGFIPSTVTVDGVEGSKYEGVRNDRTTIEYQIRKDGRMYRIILEQKDMTELDKVILQHMIGSFVFPTNK